MIMPIVILCCLFFVFLCSIAMLKNYVFLLSCSMMILSMLGVVFVLYPDLATTIANVVGIGRGTDLLLYCFTIILLILILLIHVKFARYDIIITELARSQSKILKAKHDL